MQKPLQAVIITSSLFALSFLGLAYGATKKMGIIFEYPIIQTSSPISCKIQQLTGINTLAVWIGRQFVEHSIKKDFQGHVETQIVPFSGLDLMDGKAKQVSLSGKDLLYKGIFPFSEFQWTSDPETPLFFSRDQKPHIIRPIRARMTAVLGEEELNQLISSRIGKKILTNVPLKLDNRATPQAVHFIDPTISLIENRLKFNTTLIKDNKESIPLVAEGVLIPNTSKDNLILSELVMSTAEPSQQALVENPALKHFFEHYLGTLLKASKFKLSSSKTTTQWHSAQISGQKLTLQATMTLTPIPTYLVQSRQVLK